MQPQCDTISWDREVEHKHKVIWKAITVSINRARSMRHIKRNYCHFLAINSKRAYFTKFFLCSVHTQTHMQYHDDVDYFCINISSCEDYKLALVWFLSLLLAAEMPSPVWCAYTRIQMNKFLSCSVFCGK